MSRSRTTAAQVLVVGAVVVATGVTSTSARSESPAQNARTVWDRVYTEAQAARGRASYEQACLSCHREDLRGDSMAPSLVGESFLFLWGDMEVGELLTKVQKFMPPDRPGSLPVQSYVDIIAYILQKNAFPSGEMELGADPGALQVLITAR